MPCDPALEECESAPASGGGSVEPSLDALPDSLPSPVLSSPLVDPGTVSTPSASSSSVALPQPPICEAAGLCGWDGPSVTAVLIMMALMLFCLSAMMVGSWGRA